VNAKKNSLAFKKSWPTILPIKTDATQLATEQRKKMLKEYRWQGM
jgi:hypothetical protein